MFSACADVARKAVGRRHFGCCDRSGGATSTASGGWRSQILVFVIVSTAAAGLLLAFFAPLRVSVWLSSPYSGIRYGASEKAAVTEKSASSPSPAKNLDSNKGFLDGNFPFLAPETSPTDLSPHSAPSPSPSPSLVDSWRNTKTMTAPKDGKASTVLPSPKESTGSSPVVKLPPLRQEIPLWKMSTDQQLIYAKREIAQAPSALNDPDLHAPLFRNVSIFKRSYELMERILKVYIYEDGPVPLCHTPVLGGIYSSEGWFMKLMEKNEHFVVKDPNKAHLFYLAYSSAQLTTHLYVPNSHSFSPLLNFLRGYVNLISAKYPFWNRTRGADHFLVGCHDWATYTTTAHPDLSNNTIKAVCNADVSEHIFVRGKDVSLPETYIKAPKRPQRGIGGKPALERSTLAFYAGHMHGYVRPILLQHWKGKDNEMRIYETLPNKSYIQYMKLSKFCICPKGYEVNSPRIVESIYYECVPVIISDHFTLPLDEVLDWSSFSVVIAEKDIPKLKEILLGISSSQYAAMQMNVKRLQKHFLWNDKPKKYDLFHMILHSIWFNRLNQIPYRE